APDFLLGTLFGMGGLVGGYLGAMTQRYVAERPIKIGLLVVVLGVSIKYLFF
ncbi:MAG TPA: sulfite exporter TauE/SafE family protein, partial [Dissulfuribacter thermophilus]|nr:sulfite exporter TauE/SafE family protein [Dissulfuribacter thermophilus]